MYFKKMVARPAHQCYDNKRNSEVCEEQIQAFKVVKKNSPSFSTDLSP